MDLPRAHRPRQREILARLKAIDAESMRPLRAVLAGSAAPDDLVHLSVLEAEAVALRAELTSMRHQEKP